MTVFHGTKHNDDLTGTTGNDTFDLYKGGEDTASGGDGDDRFNMGASLDAGDRLDGGTGHDTVFLHGDYSAGLVLQDLTIQNIEAIHLGAGFDYNLTLANGNVASGATLSIDGATLGAGDAMTIDASAVTAGHVWMTGGAGGDDLTGGAKGDRFHLESGGNDTVHAGDGGDTIFMGGAFTSADAIDGGAGNDIVVLAGMGDDSIGFTATTMTGVETLVLGAGHFYTLTTNDATVAAGATLTVDATALGAGDPLIFNGSNETDGNFVFAFGGGFTTTDTITGGAGNDTLELHGNYASGYTFSAPQLASIETLKLDDGFSYKLTTNDANVAAGATLTVDASALTGTNALTFNGSAETDGFFVVTGGAGDDTITGGHTAGTIHLEAGGNDMFNGGAADDVIYMGASLTAADTINGGGGANDKVILDGDYSAGLTLGATTLTNIEVIQFTAGHSYNITLNAATETFNNNTYDGSALGAGDSLVIDGSAMAFRTGTEFIGGAGNDTITGSGGATIDISLGGDDIVHCASRNLVEAGAALTSADKIFGFGLTALSLDGDYTAGITLSNVTNITSLSLGHAHSYNITLAAGTTAAGSSLSISSDAFDAGTLIADGSLASYNIKFLANFSNNTVTGGSGNDIFQEWGSGTNILHGGGGNDAFDLFGQTIGGDDAIDGGTGNDTLELDGNYSGGLTLSDANVTNIETVKFDGIGGGPYNITVTGDISGSSALKLDGSITNLNTPLTLDLTAATSPSYIVTGSPTDDTVKFGANFSAADTINGGGGSDTLELNGDYSTVFTFGASTLTNFEAITLGAGHNYNLLTNDATVAAGATMTVDASALTASFALGFNGTAETDGHFAFIGGAGTDVLEGGKLSDTFDLSLSNGANASGFDGDDTFTVTTRASLLSDLIDGGSGSDTLALNGDFHTLTTITASNVTTIETLQLLGAANSYDLAVADGIAGASTLTVDASAASSLTFDASGTTTAYDIVGSAGADHIIGGNMGDIIVGGGGADTFAYTSAAQSTSTTYDTITDFAAGTDKFDFPTTVTQVFTTAGSLDGGANFDSELTALNIMHIGGATELFVTGGTLNGHIFLLVDGDGNAQYNAGSDYVIDITGHTGAITTGDFI